eukprot:3926598-Prymnesium_polylepis.1
MAALDGAAKVSVGAQRALMAVAAWLPAESVPHLAGDVLKELAKLPADATTAQLAPLLTCAVAWEQDGALLAR